MKKLVTISFLLVLMSYQFMMAQVTGYTFSSTSGTYTEITGGIVVAVATNTTGVDGLDDVVYTMPTGTIPFEFYFNGVPYSGFNISSNGYITFGNTLPPAGSPYTPISGTAAYDGALSVVGRDLIGRFGFLADRTTGSTVLTNVNSFVGVAVGQLLTGTGIPANATIVSFDTGAQTVTLSDAATSTATGGTYLVPTGSIRVETLGIAPNRVLVIQWKRFSKFTGPGDEFNFQIRLYESTFAVETVYGNFVSNATNASPQVGLRGASNTDFNNRTTTTDWSASTAGATNSASMTLTSTVFPASGLTYTWIPANFPPYINYTALGNTALGGNRNLDGVIIQDAGGIAGGGLAPRVYWRVNAGTWTSSATSSGSSPYNFIIGTAGLVTGDMVEYFVVSQDLSGLVTANPSAGFSATDVNTITSYPTTPNSYSVVISLSGTYTVGTGDNYANLTAVSNILNSAVVTGNVIFELTNNYDGSTGETLPIVFNQFTNEGGGTNTVTIRPALGVTNRITAGDPGSNFAFPVIDVVGGDHYTFDGKPGGAGSSNEWTIRNTRAVATIGCVVRFSNDATNNVLINLNLESQATLTTTAVVFFHTSTGTLGNSQNAVVNNNIRNRQDAAGTTIGIGIYSNGTATAPNSGNSIISNNIANFTSSGINLGATGTGPDWVLAGNHIYAENIGTAAQTGIIHAATLALNTVITSNFIGGSAPGATGLMSNSGNVILTGISLTGGIATITGNTIANIQGTNTGTTARTRGITYTSANNDVVISGNTIYNLSTSSGVVTGLTAGNQAVVGIHVFPGSTFYTSTITNNTIYNLSSENTTAFATMHMSAGVFLTNFAGVFANNRIYDIKNKSTGTTAGQPPIACGVYARFLSGSYLVNNMISLGSGENTNTQFNGIMVVTGTSANISNHYYNSITISGTSGGDIGSFGFLRGDNTSVSPGATINLFNNVLYNERTGGGSINHAVGSQGTTAALNFNSNYNMLYNSNTTTVGLLDATSYDFAGWKTNVAGDGYSYSPSTLNIANLFSNIATADLNVLSNNVESWFLNGNALQSSLISSDYYGNPRSTSFEDGATDIGAVEFNPGITAPVISVPVVAGSNPVTFAGRTIADVSLTTAGTLTQLNVQYLSGVNPPLAPDSAKYGNVHYIMTPNGGASGYLYDVTLNFSDPVLGTISGRSNVRMGKSEDGGTNYSVFSSPGTGTGQYVLDTINNTIKVHGLNTFSIFALSDADFGLPVELSSFTATVNGREVLVNWTTASEQNNRGFEVERKLTDSWEKISFINGKGTTTNSTDYLVKDNFEYKSFEGKAAYRLKQIDFDGSINYSNVIEVELDFTPKEYALYQNYPNPFNPSTTIKYALPFDSNVKIILYNLLGEVVTELVNTVKETGYHDVVWNANDLASGIYFYTIQAKSVDGVKDFTSVKKMMLVK